MPLTERQIQAVRVLDWLIDTDDGERRTGRSVAMAVALIRRAARGAQHMGRYWNYQDTIPEVPRRDVQAVIRGYIEGFIASDHRLSPHVTYWPNGFRLNLPEPIADWWPPVAAFGASAGLAAFDASTGAPRAPMMNVDYAALERRIVANMEPAQREHSLRALNLESENGPTRLRDLNLSEEHPSIRDQIMHVLQTRPGEGVAPATAANFAMIYGWREHTDPDAHPTPFTSVPLRGFTHNNMPDLSPEEPQPRLRSLPLGAVQRTAPSFHQGVGHQVAYSDQMPSVADASIQVHREGQEYSLEVLKNRGPPPPEPPTAWERIVADEDDF